MRMHEWVSPVVDRAARPGRAAPGRRAARSGAAVLRALGFRAGFTHMEWYRKADGEAVFGEIGARPPGARVVDVMNYATDADLYAGWAQAVVHGQHAAAGAPVQRGQRSSSAPAAPAGSPTTRASTQLLAEYGEHVARSTCCRSGAPRRDWRTTVIGDGMVIVRHPELQQVIEMTEAFAADFQLFAT